MAAESVSCVDILRRLDQPLGTEPLRYLRGRLAHYGIDTAHFVDDALPGRPRKRFTEDLLRDAAVRCTSLREMVEYLGVAPYSSVYSHLKRRLEHFGIDTSHFTARPSSKAVVVPEDALHRAVARSHGFAEVIRELGLEVTSTSRRAVKNAISAHGISVRHFTGQGHYRGRRSPHRKSAEHILRVLPAGSRRTNRDHLHRALQERHVSYVCAECGTGDRWQGKRLVLEIDHLNGDRLDNRIGNLRYLCPSCHSQAGSPAGTRRVPRQSTARKETSSE